MKRLLTAMTMALMGVLVATAALAAPPTTDLMGQSWRAYNRVFTPSLWDINKVKLSNGGLVIPIQEFGTTTTGSFAVYLLNNYNVDLTGMTLTADLSWTAGTYRTRGAAASGAYVRFEFQDVTAGPYDSNDYWWSTGANSLDLNAATVGELSVSLTDCNLWSNQSGKSACDTTEDWLQWQGDIVHQSPAAGFAEAMKDVKQLGLSFGNVSAYASGIALVGATGTFTVSSFDVTP
ncbi:MAG: hypothetical protein ABIQ05_04205 [Candidatus Limnocylindria bacterium]